MLSFRGKLTLTDRIQGKRVKRRIGKPEQCRSYPCRHCNGHHLTSQEDFKNKHARNKEYKENRSNEQLFIRTKKQIEQWKEDSLPFPENFKTNTDDNLSNQVD